ncbi:peptidase M14 [Bacteroidia bacterium]|nr:peptidase M14 [Bacteroidia bacterium]
MKNLFKICVCVGLIWTTFSEPLRAAQKVPIKFDKFHGYTEIVGYLNAVNKAYPDITEVIEIGKSFQQRPIYVLIITNKKTGTTLDREKKLVLERKLEVPNPPITDLHLGKPGHLLTGATHGNEVTGVEVCLYFIDKMLSGYGSDSAITNLIDTKVFYISPTNNPDGQYNSTELGAAQRTNSMNQTDTASAPVRKDLNNDNIFSQVRYKDPKGRFVKDSVDSRLMVAFRENAGYKDTDRYSVIQEAEPDKGIDINRNFPEHWWRANTLPGGSGDFATSAPEVQALCEFIITHPNIFIVNEYHTQGGHVYRPMGSTGDAEMAERDLAVFDLIMGKKYSELMGTEVPPAWTTPTEIQKYKDELRNAKNPFAAKRGYELPYEWKSPYNEKEGTSNYYGLFLDWLYKQNGIYSLVTELWNPAHDVPELKGLKDEALQRGILTYLDKQSGQKMYLDWKPAKHPKHGDVEVGGWVGSLGRNNAFPGPILESICERQWKFDFFCAGLLPQMAVNEITVKKQSSAGRTTILEISAEVENKGSLPSGLVNTEWMAFNRGDVVWLIGENNKITFISGNPCEKIGNLYGALQIPSYENKGGNKKTLKWIVAVEGNEKIKVVASSLKGGTVVKEVKY